MIASLHRSVGGSSGVSTHVDTFGQAFELFLELHPRDELGRMLHSPGLKAAGRFYAFTTRHDLVVKLPAARVTELIAAGAGHTCDPRGGHPMRQWVRLSPTDEHACVAYLKEARDFVTREERR
ncbi:hypothetical protein G3I60_16080 [Streptomyces sp. SID13666]|uniref:hypothetical protein n=1 Tax=Streptomyces TaxID=1883 RepID=UPI0013C18184|nr:hypothetical protein [Streptomyces sp. SID13666]NEA55628.1 hypothetical protein [Streptomyces sp. SID13666]